MLIFNGKKYARTAEEFSASLFDASGTCNGFYRRINGGIQLFNLRRELTAFIVDRNKRDRYVVSAGMDRGRARYLFGLAAADERWLGIDENSFAGVRNAIANMRFAGLTPQPGGFRQTRG